MLKSLILPAALAAFAGAALAQVPESPVGYTGSLVSMAETSVVLKTKDGVQTVPMTKGWTVATARSVTAQDIKPGDFIATTNANVDAASGRSTEVRIFEPGYRPEIGTHAMPMPNTSITHGTVSASAKGPAGQELDITYPGGARHVNVPAGVKVTAYDLHDRSMLAPGANVTAITRKDPDGVGRAGRLLVN